LLWPDDVDEVVSDMLGGGVEGYDAEVLCCDTLELGEEWILLPDHGTMIPVLLEPLAQTIIDLSEVYDTP